MSVLSPDVHSALTQLLQGLQSADNTIRTQAETNLNSDWVNQQPDVLLLGLVEQLGQSSDEGARSFSAVLFRRLSTRTIKDTAGTSGSKELFLHLNPQTQTEIRTRLLEAYVRESVKNIQHKIADAVAELARQYTDNEVLALTVHEKPGRICLMGYTRQVRRPTPACGSQRSAFLSRRLGSLRSSMRTLSWRYSSAVSMMTRSTCELPPC